MLTSDLVRAKKGISSISAKWIKTNQPKTREKAQALIDVFVCNQGQTREVLEEEITLCIGESTDFLIQKGWVKLLTDRCSFVVKSPIEPSILRRKAFELSSQHFPVSLQKELFHSTSREEVIQTLCDELSLTPSELEDALYADLQGNHLLQTFEELDVDHLLNRYNLALVQGILFKASKIWIEWESKDAKRLKQLLRYLKFFQLMAQIENRKSGFFIQIDGPLSLFSKSQKYGLQMAHFLPALLLCEKWKLGAEILWDDQKKPLLFTLSDEDGLVSHYKDKGVYVTQEESYFRERWDNEKMGWELKPHVEVFLMGPKEVLTTDYLLQNGDKKVWIEVVGFWNQEALKKKLAVMDEYQKNPIVLLVPERLKGSKEKGLLEHPNICYYKDVILPKKLIETAEKSMELFS